jgi:8-hydroxy-5-deazaflavin:NADPH oxidoreductase
VDIGIVGTGFIAGILGRALAAAGHDVTLGSRHPDDGEVPAGSGARVATVPEALSARDAVVLALPGAAVAEVVAAHGALLDGALVVDATNRMGAPAANARAVLPATVRYARAFNTLGGEVMADPLFEGRPAEMFFSAPEADRATVEALVAGVGLRPVYVGPDQEELLDCLFRLWVTLAMTQGRGRRMALRLLEGATDR